MAITNQSEAKTISRIEELKGDIALNFKQICDLLVLVGKHYLHRDPLFRWYREVSTEKLIPEVVIAMGLKRGLLPHIAGRPRDVQMQIAKEVDFTFCTEVRGEVIEKRAGWKAMRDVDFKRMFPIGAAVRTTSEQRNLIEQELAAAVPAFVRGQPLARVDTSARTLTLGRQKVPLSIILAALREAGIQSTDVAALESVGPKAVA